MLILNSNKKQTIFAVCFPQYFVVVLAGRQPCGVLRLVLRKISSQIFVRFLSEISIRAIAFSSCNRDDTRGADVPRPRTPQIEQMPYPVAGFGGSSEIKKGGWVLPSSGCVGIIMITPRKAACLLQLRTGYRRWSLCAENTVARVAQAGADVGVFV